MRPRILPRHFVRGFGRLFGTLTVHRYVCAVIAEPVGDRGTLRRPAIAAFSGVYRSYTAYDVRAGLPWCVVDVDADDAGHDEIAKHETCWRVPVSGAASADDATKLGKIGVPALPIALDGNDAAKLADRLGKMHTPTFGMPGRTRR